MSETRFSNYPKQIDTYRGYEITLTRGFQRDKLTGQKDGDVHTRRFRKADSMEKYLKLLKADIDEWGEHDNE